MISLPRVFLAIVLYAFLLGAGVATAQQATSRQTAVQLDALEARLDVIAADISDVTTEHEADEGFATLNEYILRLGTYRNELTEIERRATTIRSDSREALDAVSDLTESDTSSANNAQASGSEPSAGDDTSLAGRLSEGPLSEVTAPYRDINRRASIAVAEARLTDIDARRLISRITRLRDDVFVSSVKDRGPIPLRPQVWSTGLQMVDDVWGELLSEARGWRAERIAAGTPFPFLILAGVALILLGGLMRLYQRFYKWEIKRNTERKPTRQTVATLAMTSFVLRFVSAIVAVAIMTGLAGLLGMNVLGNPLGRSIAFFAVAVLCMRALVGSVMAPRTTAFRLIGVGDETAHVVSLSFLILVVTFTLESVFAATGVLATPGPDLVALRTFSLALLTSGLLGWLAVRTRARTEAGKSFRRLAIRVAIGGLAAFILGASLAGYHFLARFLVERLVLVSIVLLIAILVREFIRATALKLLSGAVEKRRYASARESDAANQDDENATAMNSEFWIKAGVDTVILLLLPPFVLLAIGLPAAELWNEITWLMNGFEIGGQRISLGHVLSALLTIIAVMVATRIIQRALQHSLLPRSRISSGAANSLVTLLGYAGVIFAGVAAIGVVGFDLSSLAIIAGALSVGIGFGLQSIVSNFVAGLILLFERPFEIGDWIVTPSGEGTVRKINVRATEVETFDRRSVIVPNAELVSQAFGNWTHKNPIMRVAITVGVKYGTDTRKVEKLLLEIADANEYIRKDPAAYVVMKNFGDSSLDFELRAYIVADHIVIAPSEVRHKIAEVFEREGITIPFPQRDLNFEWPRSMSEDRKPADEETEEEDSSSDAASKARLGRSRRQAERDTSGDETDPMFDDDGDGNV